MSPNIADNESNNYFSMLTAIMNMPPFHNLQKKKRAKASFVFAAFLILTALLPIRMANANFIGAPTSAPPTPLVYVSSPRSNHQYPTSNVPLMFTVTQSPWMSANSGGIPDAVNPTYLPIEVWVDGAKVAQVPWDVSTAGISYEPKTTAFNLTLTGLSDGLHFLEVNASVEGAYSNGTHPVLNGVSTGSSGTIFFLVDPSPLTQALTASLASAQEQASQGNQSQFTTAMPIEYINYTVSSINGSLWATVDGIFPIQIPADWVGQELPMLYPTPPGVTNISISLNGQPVSWSNYTLAYPDALHYTYLGNWSMIIFNIKPASVDFLLTIHYQHPIPKANGTYLFLYNLNISPYLSDTSNSSTAYFTVRFNTDVSNIKVYTVPGESSIPRDNTRTPVHFTTTNSKGTQTVAFTITSSFDKPVKGDELIVFNYPPTGFPWSLAAILITLAAIIIALLFLMWHRKTADLKQWLFPKQIFLSALTYYDALTR